MPVVIGIFVALLVAAAVLVLASVFSARSGGTTAGDVAGEDSLWTTFRRGLTGRRNPAPDQVAAAAAAEAEPVDLSLADFLRATADDGEPYLQADDLSEGLRSAGRKAARALPGHKSA
ncbi:hypothetical protein [Cellulomonas composti]|uniref:Uncharacterized protein n=1 Tax=Cellulomonas composti TaxID=266130 RepID=A0A511J8P9_9CELL|nr:hypothetical protein [Cellulomonas composti]GEL94376.1 hypothetical protein CCO02nite_10340 [Cellulomonas composti]